MINNFTFLLKGKFTRFWTMWLFERGFEDIFHMFLLLEINFWIRWCVRVWWFNRLKCVKVWIWRFFVSWEFQVSRYPSWNKVPPKLIRILKIYKTKNVFNIFEVNCVQIPVWWHIRSISYQTKIYSLSVVQLP